MLRRAYRKSRRLLFHGVDSLNGWRIDPRETVVVNGFWRSGTTWLQEVLARALDAKEIFEPFMEGGRQIQRCLAEMGFEGRPPRFVNALMPYADPRRENPFGGLAQLERVTHRALRGQLRYRHADASNNDLRTLADCTKERVLVKTVRGAMMLAGVQRRWGSRVVHVYRDPRAVITSITTLEGGRWAEGTFLDLPIAGLLLEGTDGRIDATAPYADDVRRIDREGSQHAKLAAYYAVTERVFLEQARTFEGPHAIVRYEDLVMQTPEVRQRLRDVLPPDVAEPPEVAAWGRSSSTDWRTRRDTGPVDVAKRLGAWRQKLDSKARADVERVIADFGLEDRLYEP